MNLSNKIFIMCIIILPFITYAEKPAAIDSRIKIFVYNEHEVFKLILHYGKHAHIDFAKGEFVRSVSLGNNSNWYIEPIGSRLFIQPYEKDISTNMTIITNKRTYEFDIVAKDPDDFMEITDRDLTYVLRFFYPQNENYNNLSSNYTAISSESSAMQEKVAKLTSKYSNNQMDNKNKSTINNKYSFIGDKLMAPVEIFDDGIMTYIKFKKRNVPDIYEINENETANTLKHSKYKDYVVIEGVFHKIRLAKGKKIVEIFNDN